MTLHRSLYQSFTWRGLYFISVFLVNLLVARVFRADQSGWIYFLSTNFHLFLLLGSLGLDGGILYKLSRKELDPLKAANLSLWLSMIAALVSLSVTWILADQSSGISFSAFFYVGGILLTNFFTSFFYAQDHFARPNIILILSNIILLILLLLQNLNVIKVDADRLVSIYFLFFLLQGILLAYAAYNQLQKHPSNLLPNKSEWTPLMKYSILSLLGNVAFFIFYRIDYWFVEAYCDPHALGNYIQVSKIGQLGLLVPGLLATAVVPKVAANENVKFVPALLKLSSGIMLLFIPAFFIIWFWGESLFVFMFGETFDQMRLPLLLLMPGLCLMVLHVILAAYFAGKHHLRYNIYACLIGVVIMVPLDLWAIPRYGIIGAAAASSIAYAITSLASLFLLLQMKRQNPSGIE